MRCTAAATILPESAIDYGNIEAHHKWRIPFQPRTPASPGAQILDEVEGAGLRIEVAIYNRQMEQQTDKTEVVQEAEGEREVAEVMIAQTVQRAAAHEEMERVA